jgi:hypothetical protein
MENPETQATLVTRHGMRQKQTWNTKKKEKKDAMLS